MPTLTLTFNLPEEAAAFHEANLGGRYHCALEAVRQEVFRPARKHGYAEASIQEHMTNECCYALVGKLEQVFQDVLESNDLSGEA